MKDVTSLPYEIIKEVENFIYSYKRTMLSYAMPAALLISEKAGDVIVALVFAFYLYVIFAGKYLGSSGVMIAHCGVSSSFH